MLNLLFISIHLQEQISSAFALHFVEYNNFVNNQFQQRIATLFLQMLRFTFNEN